MGIACGTSKSSPPKTEDKALNKHLENKYNLIQSKSPKKRKASMDLSATNASKLGRSDEDIEHVYNIDPIEVGEGGFAIVRKATLKADASRVVAIKSINKKKMEGPTKYLRRELEVLRGLDHPYIAQFLECYEDSQHMHFVLEYCAGPVLVDRVEKLRILSEDEAKRIMFQLLQAVNYLHEIGIVHRDIKLDNIMYVSESPESQIRLIDFGLSRPYENTYMSTPAGSVHYVAPELILNDYDYRVDNWALGVSLYIMLSGIPPFIGANSSETYGRILSGKFLMTEDGIKTASKEAHSIIKGFLTVDKKKRLTPKQALTSPWFSQINLERNRFGKTCLTEVRVRRLMEFPLLPRFRREVIKMIVRILSHEDEEIEQLRSAFFYLDYLNNGVISLEEFETYIAESNLGVSKEELDKNLRHMNLERESSITYTEFCAALLSEKHYTDQTLLEIAFSRFDVDSSSYITPENIKCCLLRSGHNITINQAKGMVAEFDLFNDARISLCEFKKCMGGDGGNCENTIFNKL